MADAAIVPPHREGVSVGISGIVGFVAAFVVGGGLGAAALVGAVNSQTSAPSQSPASVDSVVVEYGSNN
jgi:hypothetical protein